MNLNFAETKSIAETLPIGLYAKRRVPVSMSDSDATSYYNCITDEIVISYPIIAKGVAKIEDESYKETAVRSMQYHELSHAILTPNELRMTEWLNIFEDERIETILGNYYYGVDFKKQILLINGYSSISEIRSPSSGMEDYYNIVRFGVGDKKYVQRVDEIINKYARLTRSNPSGYSSYVSEVKALYEEIVGTFTPPSSTSADEDGSSDGADGSSSASGSGATMDKVVGDKDKKSTSGKGDKSAEKKDGKDSATSSSSADGKDTDGNPPTSKTTEICGRKNPLSSDEIGKMFDNFFNHNEFVDTALTKRMEMIISNFSKKNNSGSAMNAYSGVLNPRCVGRDDYKYWEKPSTVNGANKFGSLNLNLFIDESGSFYWSEEPMNKLIKALTEIESKNKNFTMNIVFCGMGERLVTTKRDRVFKANGGNRLDKKIYDLYRKVQKPNTFNYNIACFDGDACSDGGWNDHGFGAFDHNNCTIISDRSNHHYIDADVHSARVIYTRDYAEELIDNVVEVLSKAFR